MKLLDKIKGENLSPVEQKKRRKKIRLGIIAAALVIAAIIVLPKLTGKGTGSKNVMTDFVQRGSISSIVEGSGITKTKNTETLTLLTSGTCQEVFVTEGQEVEAGTPLFTIDSVGAKSLLENARSNYEGYQKKLSAAQKDIAGLNLTPKYAGKIVDVVKLNPGDEVYKDQQLATLIDDKTMKLTQYYSYAYEDCFYVGQTIDVSIPKFMTVTTGTVEAVNKVKRPTPEGSLLFSIVVSLKNDGVLTEGLEASTSIISSGELVYPYEGATLEYNRITPLKSTVSGTVISSKLIDYLDVDPGTVLLSIDAESADNEIFELQKQIEDARIAYEKAEANLANCTAVAPITGKVIGLSVMPGQEIPENSVLVTISDASQIVVNGTVDERNISFVQPGMSVELDQWGTFCYGTVETVSWSSTINNGVATYPVTIVADNWDGMIQLNSYINYKITASQNDDCLIVPLQAVRNTVLADGTEANILYVKNADPSLVVELMYQEEEIPSGFKPVVVTTGISDNLNVEIIDGVEEGTEIFTQYIQGEYWG
ncbi:MAG: efflux RND transporter periplasmic adaptor subunit [Bacillota bacterium]|nr:efflux RND transporter periplasmic adaptor subunit [Bacillota bacterium]